jgi:hypothetical protein
MDEQDKKVVIIGGGDSLVHSVTDMIEKHGAETVLLNDELGAAFPVFPNAYKDFPLALLGTEKKKKKPCGAHEYTYRGKEEVSANAYKEIWKCRHCEKKL